MGAITSQITSLTIVFSTVYLDTDQRKHQSSASLAFVRRIHRKPVNSPHKWPVTPKIFTFVDVIIVIFTPYSDKSAVPFTVIRWSIVVGENNLEECLWFAHEVLHFIKRKLPFNIGAGRSQGDGWKAKIPLWYKIIDLHEAHFVCKIPVLRLKNHNIQIIADLPMRTATSGNVNENLQCQKYWFAILAKIKFVILWKDIWTYTSKYMKIPVRISLYYVVFTQFTILCTF